MNKQQILDEMLELLDASAVTVRREPLGGSGGGLCCINGKNIFFLDTQSDDGELLQNCSDAVLKMVNIEDIYIRPEVRQYIEIRSSI